MVDNPLVANFASFIIQVRDPCMSPLVNVTSTPLVDMTYTLLDPAVTQEVASHYTPSDSWCIVTNSVQPTNSLANALLTLDTVTGILSVEINTDYEYAPYLQMMYNSIPTWDETITVFGHAD